IENSGEWVTERPPVAAVRARQPAVPAVARIHDERPPAKSTGAPEIFCPRWKQAPSRSAFRPAKRPPVASGRRRRHRPDVGGDICYRYIGEAMTAPGNPPLLGP